MEGAKAILLRLFRRARGAMPSRSDSPRCAAAPRSEAEQVPEGETRLVGTAAPLPLTVTSLRVGGLGAVCACWRGVAVGFFY